MVEADVIDRVNALLHPVAAVVGERRRQPHPRLALAQVIAGSEEAEFLLAVADQQVLGLLVVVEHDLTSGGDLRHTLARKHDLLAHSQPVMEYLFEQVRHSQSVVILADNRGTLMHTLDDPYFLNRADRVALSCGASWHEAHRGTNAIGTALAEASGVEIHGAEHFLERNGFLTCAAAPILSATGVLLGILDISGEQRSGHPHTLGLVGTAARMIENGLLIATCRRHLRLHLHAHPEGIGSVAEGIIALSDDGWVVGANRTGLAMLHLTSIDLGATLLESAIAVRLDELRSRHKRRPKQPTQVRLHDGSTLFVQLFMDQLGLPATASPSASPVNAAPSDALAGLDTGDLRWRSAADKARRIAGKSISLLLQGESGVGKELFARATHDSGPRRSRPFVAINCAAIPESLIEAELFGYAPGAFTGARREGSPGRLREAHGGTLFLDEIGDMPLSMQTRLLRVLQERQVTPLGGARPVEVDFALICATHRQLREEADQGRFRSDLYYRLNGLTVQLPALRERTDFQLLTERMLCTLNPNQDIHLAPDLLARLSRHPRPGNMRQYASVLRTASAMLDPHEDCIDWRHLPDDMAEELAALPTKALISTSAGAPQTSRNFHAQPYARRWKTAAATSRKPPEAWASAGKRCIEKSMLEPAGVVAPARNWSGSCNYFAPAASQCNCHAPLPPPYRSLAQRNLANGWSAELCLRTSHRRLTAPPANGPPTAST